MACVRVLERLMCKLSCIWTRANTSSTMQARIFLGTWNVNAKGKEENLDEFLTKDWGPNQECPPDIVAVGFQEMVDLNAVNVTVETKSQQRSQFWVERIRATLNQPHLTRNDPSRGYTFLMQRYLVGLLVCVFVRNPHKGRVKYAHSDSVGVANKDAN